jgi:AP-1 complex subunit sigma 1/2
VLEMIHFFVEILDKYFNNVCELDLIFNFHKVILTRSITCWMK